MNRFKEFKKLDVWIRNYELTIRIYELTNRFPDNEKFGLTQQIRRASVSVISNIAEGCGRQHKKEKIQFLHIARGSLFEVESQLEIAMGLHMISNKEYESVFQQLKKSKQILNGFINYHK